MLLLAFYNDCLNCLNSVLWEQFLKFHAWSW